MAFLVEDFDGFQEDFLAKFIDGQPGLKGFGIQCQLIHGGQFRNDVHRGVSAAILDVGKVLTGNACHFLDFPAGNPLLFAPVLQLLAKRGGGDGEGIVKREGFKHGIKSDNVIAI